MEDITHQVLEELSASCPDCGDVSIDEQSFSCFPESPTHVTYRARIEGTSQAHSSYLVSLIEKWVRSGGARIIVTQIQLTVDPDCSVAIPSLTYDMECEQVIMSTVAKEPAPSVTATPDVLNSIGLIGGGVAITTILFITITIVIAIVIVKRRHKRYFWRADEYVYLS